MDSDIYQMWITHNGGRDNLRLPMLPEEISVSNGSSNTSVDIAGLGEIVIKQGRPAILVEFESCFPRYKAPGISPNILQPWEYVQMISAWKEDPQPVQFIVTGTLINLYCTIEDFSWREIGGDVGTYYYKLTFKEHRNVWIRQVEVDVSARKALLSDSEARTDNRVQNRTYTVVPGDCLYTIAKRELGDASRWGEIYDLNRDQISVPSMIYSGQVLQLPA